MILAVDADADGDGQHVAGALAFNQDAGKFGAAAEDVIRPFQRQHSAQLRRALEDRVVERQRGDKRQLRGTFRRRRISQKQCRVEIAGRRHPFVAAAAAAGGLLRGDDPERVALAGARACQRFGIGRRQRVMGRQTITRRRSRRGKLHQNSEWAAALATLTSGPG